MSEGRDLRVLKANYNFIAVPVDPGTRRIKLIYDETGILLFSYVMICLGLAVFGWFFISGRRTSAAWYLIVAAAVLILYSLLELPSVGNDDLPERLERHAVLPNDT